MKINSNDLPKLSLKTIRHILSKKPLEDLELIDQIENSLKRQRGYIFKMPQQGSPVILLLSGGLDTIIFWDILLRKYKLHVYPVFLRRGQIRMPLEEASVDFFSKYYLSQYKELFQPPKKLTTFIPPLEIRWDITKFGTYIINDTRESRGIPMYSSLLVDYAIQYAYFLEINLAIKPRTIFCGFMNDDGDHMRYETLTALRLNTYNIINLTGDMGWQFTSLAIEKELGFNFNKEVLIKYADFYKIPIDHSFSCIKYSYYHCGRCIYCKTRIKLFRNLGVKDRTIYQNQSKNALLSQIINRIKLILLSSWFMVKVFFVIGRNFLYFIKYRY